MAAPASRPENRITQTLLPFVIGGVSGMAATVCIHPIDTVKVRLQLTTMAGPAARRPSPVAVARDIVARGRFVDLYEGLSAGLLRQVMYGTSRLGFFGTFENGMKRHASRQGRSYTFFDRAAAGIAAGALGALIGNPAEVALIRMQSDGMRPREQRARYRSVVDAVVRIVRSEGVRTLWSGTTPTVVRAMSTNFGQLTFFSEAKHQLAKRTSFSQRSQTIVASGIAGTAAAMLSLPFDFTKTRLQRQTRLADGSAPYKGMRDCFVQVARAEGVRAFYTGFGPYYLRIAPHA
ncbi:2-oxoglutarate/malate carrier protein [Aspergillus carlsbadensis]|nr:2-oxoglutarate/malate carrier protein [Aspergillus carlsbadensis]